MCHGKTRTSDMRLLAEYNNLTFAIVEDKPEVGFYLYIYDKQNICIRDYVQETEQMAKEFAFEEFSVPLNSWTVDYSAMCCFCGDSLPFEKTVQLTIIVDKDTGESQTIFSHKQCLDKVLHRAIVRHPDLLNH